MTYRVQDFASEVRLEAGIHRAYPNVAAELTTIATALGSDVTTHDVTLQTPPAALMPGLPSHSKFTNDVLASVNRGKAGNLTPAQMAAAITAGIASEVAPVNTVAPVVSGTGTVGLTLSCTTGTWLYSPTYAYQWLRNGTAIPGAAASTYVLVAADSGTNAMCRVTGTNPAGSATVPSNAITVT